MSEIPAHIGTYSDGFGTQYPPSWMGERDEKAAAIRELVERSFDPAARTRVIGIFGPWGTGKTSLIHQAVCNLSERRKGGSKTRWQMIYLRPRYYERESEFASALLKECLLQLQIEATGLKRLKVRARLWLHDIHLKRGLLHLGKQIFVLAIRLIFFVLIPAAAFWSIFDEQIAGIVASFGGSALVAARVKTALEPGLDFDPDEFVSRVKEGAATNETDQIVEEFKVITTLARSMDSRVIVIMDPVDVGLPLQTAMILEALRLFDAVKAPCAYILTADDFASLRTAVQIRFLNQFSHHRPQLLMDELAASADSYLNRLLVQFDLVPPTKSEVEKAFQSLIESNGSPPETAGKEPVAES